MEQMKNAGMIMTFNGTDEKCSHDYDFQWDR